jgi:simple sugar transport system permease protein
MFLSEMRLGLFITRLLVALTALGIALALTVTIMLSMGFTPRDAVNAYKVMFLHGFTDPAYLLDRSSPLILTSLAFALPALTGMFNIGSESQVYVGALASLVVARSTGNAILAILAGFFAGVLHGLFIGVLRVYGGVNEVITSVMLNWALYFLTMFIVITFLADPIYPYLSVPVPESAKLRLVLFNGVVLSTSFIFAIAITLAMAIIYYRTVIGFALKAVGLNIKAAILAGFDYKKLVLLSFAIGGGCGGIGGALLLLGMLSRIDSTMSGLHGYGFVGIGASMLAGNNPLGIIVTSVFLTGLIIGGQSVERLLGLPHQVEDLIIGLIIASLTIPIAYRYVKVFRGG